MDEARGREAWAHTSNVIAYVVNAAPFRKGAPAQPRDFNPYAPRPEPLDMTVEDMTAIFVGKPKPPPTSP